MSGASTFSAFSKLIDNRILRSLADIGIVKPTPVQAKTIPLALEGHDILARARTGSGKTAAYCIPIIQKLLSVKAEDGKQITRVLILVPTRELAEQVTMHIQMLLSYCEDVIQVVNAAGGTVTHLQKNVLSEKPDILVATPSRALSLCQSKAISLTALESLVVDEADLIFSYGYDEDVRSLFGGEYLSTVFQSFLMSATLTEDVNSLKGLVLRDPKILNFDDEDDQAANLTQHVIRCSEVDKFLLTYVILKLKLVKGKCILFVNDVDRCYRLKLFLEQFSIQSCVLNSELPLNSRVHTVQEFNKGVYDYIIATDEDSSKNEQDDEDAVAEEEPQEEFIATQRESADNKAEGADEPESSDRTGSKRKRSEASPPPNRKRKTKHAKHKRDKEYGVTRGIDFIDVNCVLNFDLPTSSRAYTHRVGRTARAGRSGMALSYVVPKEQWGLNKVVGGLESTKEDESVWERIERDQRSRGSKVLDYKFDKAKVEAFRYRMEDALRSVTRSAIKEARIKELKNEILNSDKLKAHFEDNPLDLEYLRHDKPLHPMRVQPHMKHVPKYLLPGGVSTEASGPSSKDVGFVPFRKSTRGRGRGRGRGGSGGSRGHKNDPLKKFKR